MKARAHSVLMALAVAAPMAIASSSCSQTPVVVPVRSMERPKDIDFICLQQTGLNSWRGVPLERCHVDVNGNPSPIDDANPTGATPTFNYRLHAVVTQVSRGELAVVDLGAGPGDTDGVGIVKVDPRLPGFTFLPVGPVPTDVAADPSGRAVFVASANGLRVDIIPSEFLRGPINTELSAHDGTEPWPHVDFDPKVDGPPSRLAVVRDPTAPGGGNDRLYVTLPEARGGAKVAVFDLGVTPLVPPRIGDIHLTFNSAAPIGLTPLACGKKVSDPTATPSDLKPWWIAYDSCKSVTTVPGGPAPDLSGGAPPHLAGITVAAGMMFAADDASPVVHVFDIAGGRGVETYRIGIGARTSSVSVSPPVPDEVNSGNALAIGTCEAHDWVGDGLDHSGDSSEIQQHLKGRCRAHRYLYAVDLNDVALGDGSVAVVDLPVTFGTDPTTHAILRDPRTHEYLQESVDLTAGLLEQPMGCDSPALTATRIPLGPYGVGGFNDVPARAVTFVRYDPPSPTGLLRSRCRPGPLPGTSPEGAKCSDGASCQSGVCISQGSGADKTQVCGKSNELEGIDPATKAALIGSQNAWQPGVDPRRLRGVFALAALDNGSVAVIDVDDFDSLCRGPTAPADRIGPSTFVDDPTVTGTTGEYFSRVSRRHHPRSGVFYNAQNLPTITSITLTSTGNSLAFDASTPEGRAHPHLLALKSGLSGSTSGTPTFDQLIVPSPDNPYAITTEVWSVTYQGILPGFGGTAGSFVVDKKDGTATLNDPAGHFCRRGVEAELDDAGTIAQFNTHDILQIVDDVCTTDSCSADELAACTKEFGLSTAVPLASTREMVIRQAFEDHVTIQSHSDANGVFSDGPPKLLATCFKNLTRYSIRARDSWLVYGSISGYLHRRRPETANVASSACIVDPSKPAVFEGRAIEHDPTSPLGTELPPLCLRFQNPAWSFLIEGGIDVKGKRVPTLRDSVFTFGARFSFTPLALNGGSLPTAIKPVSRLRGGLELLGWNQFGVVDAIDRGLTVFGLGDLSAVHIVN